MLGWGEEGLATGCCGNTDRVSNISRYILNRLHNDANV